MLAFESGVKEWCRARAAPSWLYRTRRQGRMCWRPPGPFEPIERDLGPAIAVVWALYESTLKDSCVMDWALDEATMERTARP